MGNKRLFASSLPRVSPRLEPPLPDEKFAPILKKKEIYTYSIEETRVWVGLSYLKPLNSQGSPKVNLWKARMENNLKRGLSSQDGLVS